MDAYQQLDALGDATRRAIVDRLRQGPLPVGRIAEGLPVSRPAVSQHLRVLERARLVSCERRGTRRIYRLQTAGFDALRSWVDGLWGGVLDAFREAAEEAARRTDDDP